MLRTSPSESTGSRLVWKQVRITDPPFQGIATRWDAVRDDAIKELETTTACSTGRQVARAEGRARAPADCGMRIAECGYLI